MATRRLKFKAKPVVGPAVRRAKDSADTSTDSCGVGDGGVTDNSTESTVCSVQDTPSSGPPSNTECKEGSSAVEDGAVCSDSQKLSQDVNSVSHVQNNGSTQDNNHLVLPCLEKPSQVIISSVSRNKNSVSDTQGSNVSSGVNGLVTQHTVDNSTVANSKDLLNQATGCDNDNSTTVAGSIKSVIVEAGRHNSELQCEEAHQNNEVILTKKNSMRTSADDSLGSDKLVEDSSNDKLQPNEIVKNGESVEPLSNKILENNDSVSSLGIKIVETGNSVFSPSDKKILENSDSVTSLIGSMLENSDLTRPPNEKIVENKGNTTVKPPRSSDKCKTYPRFARPRCKPVFASNTARRKTEEITGVNTNNINNSVQEIKNKPLPSEGELPFFAVVKVSEISVAYSDFDNESEVRTDQNTCQSEENTRTTSVSDSVQSHKTDLVNNEVINESSQKTQGISYNSDNVNNNNNKLNTVDDLRCAATTATTANSNSTKETNNNNNVVDSNTQVAVTTTPTTDLKPFKTFSKAKRHHRTHGATYSKMGQDTMEKLKQKFGNELPDKNQLKMKDLIFYNPKTNPMSKTTPQMKPSPGVKSADSQSVVEEILNEQKVDEVEDDVEATTTTPAVPVPQLKIGPDGQVILDPKSLIIETTEMQKSRQNLENSEIILETDGNYGCYSKKRKKRHDWRPEETLQFYRALHTIGTDFTLMATLFPNRTRRELKLKFKYEEKVNLSLVDKAITNPREFDFELLKSDIRKENEERDRRVAEELRIKEELKKHRELLKQQKQKMSKLPRKSFALKEFNAEDTGEVYGSEKKKKPRKPENKRKHTDESTEECEQETIFDYRRIDKMCRAEDKEKRKKKDAEMKKNRARKPRTNNKTVRLSKRNDNKGHGDDNDKDDVDIIGNILSTTRSGRMPKRKKRIIEEAMREEKKKVKTYVPQKLENNKLKHIIRKAVKKCVGDGKRNEITTPNARISSHNIDDHNNESDASALSAELDDSLMSRVNLYNSEDLTASVTRLTGQIEKRIGLFSNLKKQTSTVTAATTNSSSLPGISSLTPGIHNSRALSESMKIIDQLTSDVETACVEMSEDRLMEIINEASLNQIENENISVEDTAAASNTDTQETNSIINVRNSSDRTNNRGITIITFEFPQSNSNSDSNAALAEESGGGECDSVSLIVPHYEVITGDVLDEEVTYYSGTGADLTISDGQHSGPEEETFLILEETPAEEQQTISEQQQNQQQQQQQQQNILIVENMSHATDSECILGE